MKLQITYGEKCEKNGKKTVKLCNVLQKIYDHISMIEILILHRTCLKRSEVFFSSLNSTLRLQSFHL